MLVGCASYLPYDQGTKMETSGLAWLAIIERACLRHFIPNGKTSLQYFNSKIVAILKVTGNNRVVSGTIPALARLGRFHLFNNCVTQIISSD